MSLDNVRALVSEQMKQVDHTIASQFGADIELIKELSEHIFGGGGKRLRPMLALLSAKACGYEGQHHVTIAAIVELIHTATLLHDDVVDESSQRRGKKTANVVWGNSASVLVGDFLYSRSFQMMVQIENMTVMSILANASNTIAEGEVMQLVNCNDPKTTTDAYMETIRRKTATVFQAATEIGAIIAQESQETITALRNYGLHLGIAFQLVDDILDYGFNDAKLGKNMGDDLREGKPTLPLIHALAHGSQQQKALINAAIKQGKTEHVDEILQAIKTTGALEVCMDVAKEQSQKAIDDLSPLPESKYKKALMDLATFACNRSF